MKTFHLGMTLASLMLSSAVLAAPPQETVTVRAAALQAKADHHSELATLYRARAMPGSKQLITYFTMANHCDQLAARERLAASEIAPRG